MIRKISLRNFKCFKSLDIGLAKLTLLAGVNSAGKSSVIQVILLARQSFWSNKGKGNSGINLNGELVYMGTANDVLHEYYSDGPDISASLYSDAEEPVFRMRQHVPDTLSDKGHEANNYARIEGNPNVISIFNDNFYFVGAERLGSRVTNSMMLSDVSINAIGSLGEYAPALLKDIGRQ